MARTRYIIGNWKMNGSVALVESFRGLVSDTANFPEDVRIGICPPFPLLSFFDTNPQNQRFLLGAQNASRHVAGAHTGETDAQLLSDLGCKIVIVGHSERRANSNETSELVAYKAQRVLELGMTPVICVGETEAQREAGDTLQVIADQLTPVQNALGDASCERCVYAYEPVWAIGTGKTATPQQAQDVHRFIRETLGEKAAATSILYGGSVKPANAKELFDQPDIDGGLIGGASLDASDFLSICQAAD